MFEVGKIDEDTVGCPLFVAFEGASHEDNSLTRWVQSQVFSFGTPVANV